MKQLSRNGRDEKGRFAKGHTLRQGTYIIKPNLNMSPNLAHLLGIIHGDGYVYRNYNEYIIGLHTVNKQFVKTFKECLSNIGLHPSRIYESIEHSDINGYSFKSKTYRVVAASNMFGEFVKNLSYNDLYNSLISKNEFVYSFLKGIFESEGHVRKDGIHGYRLILLYNTDKDLIELNNNLVKYLGYDSNILLSKKEAEHRKKLYCVNILGGSRKKLELLKEMNPVIKNEFVNVDTSLLPETIPYNRKLTDKTVIKIRDLKKKGEKQYLIAKEFGINQSHVSRIVNYHIRKGCVTYD